MKYIVVGMATASRDIEIWLFDDYEYAKKFCIQQARETARSVYLLEGKVIASFEIEIPVKITVSP